MPRGTAVDHRLMIGSVDEMRAQSAGINLFEAKFLFRTAR